MIDAVESSGICRDTPENHPSGDKSDKNVLYLSPDQSQAPFVEVRNSSGKVCCYLFQEATLLLTPAEFSDIKRRASVGKPGQSLSEILREVCAGVGA